MSRPPRPPAVRDGAAQPSGPVPRGIETETGRAIPHLAQEIAALRTDVRTMLQETASHVRSIEHQVTTERRESHEVRTRLLHVSTTLLRWTRSLPILIVGMLVICATTPIIVATWLRPGWTMTHEQRRLLANGLWVESSRRGMSPETWLTIEEFLHSVRTDPGLHYSDSVPKTPAPRLPT